jgi:hypothetical protein
MILMELRDLEAMLVAARARMDRALAALAPKHKGGELEEYLEANDECLACERALAAAKGEEFAGFCEWALPWDAGAPMPILIASEYRTILIYLVRLPHDPAWDGRSVTVIEPAKENHIALVEFFGCTATRFGAPNDEVLSGHPLYGKGLEPYRAHLVNNSRWITELQRINSVHTQYDPQHWVDRKHYLLGFHDSMFECIADRVSIDPMTGTFADAIENAKQRLLE